MEFFVFIIFLLIVFGALSGEKKTKPVKPSRVLRGGGRQSENDDDFPSDWKRYESAETQEGMQDDLDPSKLFAVSKAKLETARRSASKKLSYQGLPTTKKLSPKKPKAKNKGRTIIGDNGDLYGQQPLVQDMNVRRRLFLTPRGSNVFGEREKTRVNSKTILALAVLGLGALYILQTSVN